MRREVKYGLFFISPSILFFLVLWIVPVILAVYYSLTNWKVGRPEKFIGLENYTNLLADPQFRQALQASALITIVAVACTLMLSLGLAVLLNDDKLRGSRLFKTLIILPVIT
ncbi:MAG TPA: sugar ABC transporter permease, partial [Anaerolineae bacterium]|nr:sugar ABC transporter permease [Anaerolineae bacterium]